MATVTNGAEFVGVENSFALAIAVLRERVSGLSKDDQSDLYELLPAALGADEEERQSAFRAINEILAQSTDRVSNHDIVQVPATDLQSWLTFVSGRIKDARKKANLTQDQLAEKTGIPQSHISRLEKGEHSPTFKTLEKIAEAVGCPVSDFDPCA